MSDTELDELALQDAEREMAEVENELAWELSKAVVDAAGLIDPTPVSDTVGAALALADGDLIGAGLSLISIVPYVGDAVGKTAKGARVAKKLTKLRAKIGGLAAKIKKIKTNRKSAAERAKEVLGKANRLPESPPMGVVKCRLFQGNWPNGKAKRILGELETLNKPPKTKAKTQRKRVLSEQLGNEAAKHHLRKKLGRDIPDCPADGECFTTFNGAHTVNVYLRESSGKVHVLEAKGGNSQLGTRVKKYPPNKGKELNQGSREYLEDVANAMKNSRDPAKRQAGRDILDALEDGNIDYVGVRGAYNKSAPASAGVEPEEIFSVGAANP